MKKMAKYAATLLILWMVPYSVSAAELLIPVGQVIGLELEDDSVTVAAFDEEIGAAARSAGLQVGDRLLSVDEQQIRCTADVRNALDRSEGTVEIFVLRDGKRKQLRLAPAITTEGPKLGVYLREGITGVGTVTWYDPESGSFGALGHGVNTQNGELLQLRSGQAYRARILSVRKGRVGSPGQLMGSLQSDAVLGSLTKNTQCGVFGNAPALCTGEPLPVCDADEVQTGAAVIRSTVESDQVQEYSVEILKIYPQSKSGGRNMLLRVTDPKLLAATGGIVQGMSGSPIIQNGKLVGAVTHVCVT